MRSTSGKVVALLAALVAAMALFLVLRDSGDDDPGGEQTIPAASETQAGTSTPPALPTEPEPVVIEVKNGEPVGGPAEIELDRGDRIRFVVRSDVNEEVHLHGYDVSKAVSAGGKVSFDLPADIDGIFEVELEHSAVPIAEIRVDPR